MVSNGQRLRIEALVGQTGPIQQTYVFGAIPDQKRRNAVRAFAKGIRTGETPVLLFDNTVFQSAKHGFLLTDRMLYTRNIAERPTSVRVEDIRTITYRTAALGEEFTVNARGQAITIQATFADNNKQGRRLFELLRDAVEILNESPHSSDDDAASATGVEAPTPVATAQNTAPGPCPQCGAPGQRLRCEYCDALLA
ncbi:MAG: hypothetical protein LBH13_10935 [Cellulomonadaceae bacterium]|jgi:hypothetical protein|nr:hypothetical protein [Cellulomonadaceae bacterium]